MGATLSLSAYDYDAMTTHDPLGHAQVQLNNLTKGATQDQWINLSSVCYL